MLVIQGLTALACVVNCKMKENANATISIIRGLIRINFVIQHWKKIVVEIRQKYLTGVVYHPNAMNCVRLSVRK